MIISNILTIITIIVLIGCFPRMIKKLQSNAELTSLWIVLIFIYAISGFGIASWLVSIVTSGAFMTLTMLF